MSRVRFTSSKTLLGLPMSLGGSQASPLVYMDSIFMLLEIPPMAASQPALISIHLKGTMAPVLMRIGTLATWATYSLVRMESLKFVWTTCRFRLQDRIRYSEELLLFTLILMISAEVDMSLARQPGILVPESAVELLRFSQQSSHVFMSLSPTLPINLSLCGK